MEYGAEIRIGRNCPDDKIVRAKAAALRLLAREAGVSVETIIASQLKEGRRDDPSGAWWYQVRVEIADSGAILQIPY